MRSSDVPSRSRYLRHSLVFLVLMHLCFGVFIAAPGTLAASPAAAVERVIQPQLETTKFAAEACAAGVNAQPERPRQVNLVLDDSGSMFFDGKGPLNRWSNAKYSLEVFAAMMGVDDTLNVYRMSDFKDGALAGPLVAMTGNETTSDRVAKIHGMQLQGGGTPYAPVTTAAADLSISSAPEKWLVILSDGEFNDRRTEDVQADLTRFAAEGTTADTKLQVAFLAIGPEAPHLTNDPGAGVFFEQAPQTAELLGKMTGFSNRIFARSLLPQSSPGQLNPDIDLDQVLVFAQGTNVKIGSLSGANADLKPLSKVQVSWVDNGDALVDGARVPAVPNKALSGTLASFQGVAAGTSVIDVRGAQTVDVFYVPHAAFGVELLDAEGLRVDADKIVGGKYTVNYGFMDAQCEFVESALFGDIAFTAQVSQNGKVVSDSFAPGDLVQLDRGEAQFRVEAQYLEGKTSEAVIDLQVLRPAKPTGFEAHDKPFDVSALEQLKMPVDAMELRYAIHENGKVSDFGAEEWASFTDESFTVTTPEQNIAFDVRIGEHPGQVFVLPYVPKGDVYAAATGDIPVTIAASHVYDEQLNEATFETTVTVNDDLSFWDRAVNWFTAVGFMWLLGLLFVLLLLGYVVRRRLPKNLKQRPLVDYRPKALGGKRAQFDARVERNRLKMFIPYTAETGSIRPPTSVRGIPALKIKAVGGGRFEATNWKQLAQSGRVSFDGEQLTKETTKIRSLRGSSNITVLSNEGSYDMQLNQTRGGRR